MNNNLLSRVAAFLKQRMRTKRWQRAMTCLAAVVVFGVTYALILPAITMTGQHPTLSAETLTAWTGDELAVKVSAEAKGDEIVVFTLEGEGADLSQTYAFNEEGICVITDEEEKEIELHRVVREDAKNTVDYWFAMGAGTKTVFTLNLADEVDETRFSEIMAAVESSSNDKEVEKASASDAGKSAAVKNVKTGNNATGSNADRASASNADVAEANSIAEKEEEKIVTESHDSGFVEILDGAVVNDLMGEDEDEEQTETVAELKVTAGSGADYDEAVEDVKKNADKRGDAQLKLKWIDVVASAPELVADVNDATIAVFFDDNANIPAGAKLSAEEIPAGSDEYQALLAQADPAVTGGAEKMVTAARFFNISILDEDENEIQPEAPVKVVIAYKDGISITETGDLTVVHFDEESGAEVYTSVKNENGQEAEGIAFIADHFSVFGLVGAENLAAGEIAAEAENCTVKVKYESNAKLLGSDTLSVSEIPGESGRYQAYMTEAGSLLVGKGKAAEISSARFFDISILRNGERIQPAAPVEISIEYAKAQDLGKGTELSALNFKENGTAVLDVNVNGSETQLSGVSFGMEAVSTFGIAGTRGGKTKSLTAEGSSFKMTVAYGTEAEIPEGAKLEAEEVAEGTEAAAEYKKLAAEATKSKEEELSYIKVLKAAIVDAEGKKIQPAAPVEVELSLTDKKNEFETMAVFFGEETSEVITPQAEGDKVSFEAAQITDCAIVETKAPKVTKITGKASDGATVEITGKLPEGAEAKIVPVTLTQEQLVEYYGEDLVKAVDNLVVYDICVMVDGKEWEPDDSVSVVINNPKIETKTNSNEEIAVTHIDDEKKAAEKMDTVVTDDGGVGFDTKSFSLWGLYTYTVDFYLDDKEYHMPGNTSMLLSELFAALQSTINVQDVANVTFTSETLLKVEPEGADWRLTSLLPFNTDELLIITMTDGSQFSILTQDIQYPVYTYDDDDLQPFTGSFAYHGHYDIFGGGNGISSVTKKQSDVWWKGNWGGNSYWNKDWSGTQHGHSADLPMLNGKAVGKDHAGNNLQAEAGKYKSGASAVISWDDSGAIDRAFLSIGWLYYSNKDGSGTAASSTHGHFNFTLYAPDGASTVIDIPSTDAFEDDGRTPEDEQTTNAWRILSFEATDFVSAHGKGKYTMVLELTPCAGQSSINSYIADMGFSIYGITADATKNTAAIAGIVDEKMIYGINDATPYSPEAEFKESIVPRGNGKAWFNCHGGETHDGNTDIDYLEVKKADGTYLKLGTGGDIPVVVPEGNDPWEYNDIAKPNHNQTAPSGYTKFNNCFSFGMGSFSGLENKGEMSGVRKSMLAGNDCFGSIMLLVEVMPGEGVVEATKQLDLDGNGIATTLQEDATFEFTLSAVDGAPLPVKKNAAGELTDEPNTKFTVTFPRGMSSGQSVNFDMGTFVFKNLDGNGPWYFNYNIVETRVPDGLWARDSRTLRLTFKIIYDHVNNQFIPDPAEPYTWSDPAGGPNHFVNNYTIPVALKVDKKNLSENSVSGATFCLYTNEGCTTVAPVYKDAAKTIALTSSGVDTDSNGFAYFYGLNKGTAAAPAVYYLKEIGAPTGYVLDSTVVAVSYNVDENKWYYTPAGGTATVIPGSIEGNQGYLTIERVNLSALHVIKVDKKTNAALPNVTFKLTRSDTADGTKTDYVEAGHAAGDNTYTTDADGKFDMKLPVGYYLLKETATPQGYVINTDCQIEFQVVDEGDSQVFFTNTDFATYDGSTFTFTAKNTRGQSLPNTGGPGTTLYTLGGMMLLIASALLYGFRRRHEERRSM